MGESTLSVTFAELKAEVGFLLGFTRTEVSWDATDAATIAAVVKSGLRHFYTSPVLPGMQRAYQWKFLRLGSFLATIAATNYYTLPDNCGAIAGPMTYTAGANGADVKIVGESQIRSLYQYNGNISRKPEFGAVIPLAIDGSTEGQRLQLWLYPIPDAIYNLTYRYMVIPDMLVKTTAEYPLGGMYHSETILQACLSMAEKRVNSESDVHQQAYYECLAKSIAYDQQMASADYIGVNSDGSDGPEKVVRNPGLVTFEGVLY